MSYPSPHHRWYTPSVERRRGNPYFSKRQIDRLGSSRVKNYLAHIPPRVWFYFFVLVILTFVLLWLFFISNILVIKNLKVEGNNLIKTIEIEQLAQKQINQSRWLVFSQNRLLVFNSADLKQTIKEHYNLEQIKISKKLPKTLIISLQERTPVAVWFEAETYQEIDSAGWILLTTNGEVEGLPIIYNNGWPKINHNKIEGADKEILFAKNLWPEFKKRFPNITVKQLTIDNDRNSLKLLPLKGAMIYFSTTDDLMTQLDRLDILLLSELKDRFEKVNYIDLRYGDKVYYK
jgi:cell division septal protein FtsQ